MILNKFPVTIPGRQGRMMLLFLVLIGISCQKTANSNSNKAFVNVTHVAYQTGPVTVTFNGVPLFADPLAFGMSSGNTVNPYDTTTAGVHDMQVLVNDSAKITGNYAFQQASYYSMFVYDTLDANTIGIIIFQNSHGPGFDTTSYIRFLNFTPGSKIGIKVIYPRDTTGRIKASYRDTVNIGPNYFVGYNPNPALYGFAPVHIGKNDIWAFTDSSRPHQPDSSNFRHLGSITFDSLRTYNVYLQGYPGATGVDSFQIKSYPVN